MKIIKFEFLKIITNKFFIMAFLVLWFLNILFLGYQNYSESKQGIPYQAYKMLEADLNGKTHEEKGEYIDKLYERANGINIIYNIQNHSKSENPAMREYASALREENKELYHQYYEESKNPVWKYTGDSYAELSFLERIKNDYHIIDHYQNSIHDILEESDKLKEVSIFKNTHDISLKNIIKTAHVYQNMLDTKIDYEIGKGIEKISSVSITDFFVLILVFVLSTILITEEKEKNLFTIIKSTKNGHLKTILSKLITLFLITCFLCLFFYGTNFLYYLITLGFGNIFSTVQSVPILMLCSLKLNILEYLILLFAGKIMTIFLLAILMFYLAVRLNNVSESMMVLVILIFISSLLCRIDSSSNINLLKSFNLINLINTYEIFRIYENLRFYDILTSKTSTLLVLQMTVIILLIILSTVKYLKNMNITTKENKILSKLKDMRIFKNIRFYHVFCFETYKLLFVNKGLIIMILFTIFTGLNFKNQNFNLSYSEMFYKNYMEILNGELTPEKIDLIENTIEEYDKASEQLAIINEKLEKSELSHIEAMTLSQPYEDILATREIFSKIEDKYYYIKETPQASFVYDTGYNKLFRINQTIHENDIYLIIITIMTLANLFVMEYKTSFIQILNTTKNGRKKTAKNKIIAALLTCTMIYIINIIPEILEVYKMYGLDNLNKSIISLETFHHLPANISILYYLICYYIVRYFSYVLVVLIIMYISLKLKNRVFSILTSTCVLLIPFMTEALKLFPNHIFPFMNLSIINENISYIIFVPLIVMMSIFLYTRVVKRWE